MFTYNHLLRSVESQSILGLKHSCFHERILDGLIPQGVKVGERAVRYPSNEIEAVRDLMIAGADDDTIRARVKAMVADRAALLKEAA